MRKLGLDPSTIKYIVVTHAHGDHYGGVEYLVPRYRSGVVVSEIDWQQLEGKLEFSSPHWGPVPKYNKARDLRVKDGDKVTLGDTTVTIYITPGHTLGTITPTFEVKQGSRTHKVLIWGGTAFNFGKDVPRLQSYIDATERMATIAKEQGIDVMISNHAGYDNTVAKLDAIRNGACPEPVRHRQRRGGARPAGDGRLREGPARPVHPGAVRGDRGLTCCGSPFAGPATGARG